MMAALARMRNAIRRDIEAIVGQTAQPRFATVAAVDETTHSVRVEIQPEGVLSGWIPDASAMSAGGGYGIISPLSVGNQVKVIFSHGDADFPVIVGRVLSTVDPVPQSPATGTFAKPGELLIATPGGAFMHFQDNGQVAGGGAKFTWTGDVEFDGNVTVTKTLTAQQDVVAGPASVSSVNHTHPDVQTGDGNTGKPQG